MAASNVVVEGREPVARDELLRRVGNGLYVGRIWYTYPINGPRASSGLETKNRRVQRLGCS